MDEQLEKMLSECSTTELYEILYEADDGFREILIQRIRTTLDDEKLKDILCELGWLVVLEEKE